MDNTNIINIVVWAQTSEKAQEIAGGLTKSSEDNGHYTGTFGNNEVRVYVRYPDVYYKTNPSGVTDILLVHITEENNEAKTYINHRKGIPFKFVSSGSDLNTFASENDSVFIPEAELASDEFREKLIASWNGLETSLRNAFNKIDINKNGFITADELVHASAELGHTMNSEEAKAIATTLSNDGNVSFSSFKQWWIMGRTDFFSFRNLVRLELGLNNFVKQKSQAFNDYLAKLKLESESSVNEEVTYKANVNIGSTEDFENGISLDVDIAGGKEAESLVETLPDYIKKSPISFGIEIHCISEDQGANILSTLEQFKEMVFSIPQVSMALGLGAEVNFRQVGLSIFIDLTVSGMLGDQISSNMAQFNFSGLNFTGNSSTQIITGLKPTDVLYSTFDEIFKKVLQFKLQMKSQYSGAKDIIKLISKLITDNASYSFKKKAKPVLSALYVLIILREINYEFKYDVNDLVSSVKELINFDSDGDMTKLTAISMQFEGGQAMMNQSIEPVKEMAGAFIAPFADAINAINLDRLSFFLYASGIKSWYKFNLNLPGLNAFVKQNLLN